MIKFWLRVILQKIIAIITQRQLIYVNFTVRNNKIMAVIMLLTTK